MFRTYSKHVFPHIFVWGSCFWFCIPPSVRLPSSDLLTHNLSSHHLLTHNLLTHNFSSHHLLWHPPSLCVVGVALRDIHLHFAWQAWHFVTSTFTLRGRRGTSWHPPSLCVAGVALRDIHLHFVWQAWHLVTSTFSLRGTFTLRGRRGTWWHPPSLCVAGVALAFTLRGRRGTLSLRCQVKTAGNDVPFWFYLLSLRCQVTTSAFFASAFMDDIFFLSRPYVSVADTFSFFLGSLCCTGLSRCAVCCAQTFAVALALWHTLSTPCVFRRDGGTCCTCRHWTPGSQTAMTPRPPHTTSHLESMQSHTHTQHTTWHDRLEPANITSHLKGLISCSVEKTRMRLIHRYLHTYIRIDNFIHTTAYTSRTFSPHPLSFLPSPSQLLLAHTHTHTHTHHTQLITTQRTHTYSSTHTTCSTPILHHLFSLSCFPHAIFTFLLLLVGRSWYVGLSGPLIFFRVGCLSFSEPVEVGCLKTI